MITIDIFIPCTTYHYKTLPSAIWSALTQTYENVRLILYMDGVNDDTEKLLDRWLPMHGKHNYHVFVNKNGPTGNAGSGRDWYFNFENKADWVKFLDADDTLTPRTIEVMAKYINTRVDAVFCPLQHISSNRYYHKIDGTPIKGHAGSGSMMLSKSMINSIKDEFSWKKSRGDDEIFLDFIANRYNIVTTKEDFLYLYYK